MYWSAALLWSDFWNNVYITTTTNDDENRDANETDLAYLGLHGRYSESKAHTTWKHYRWLPNLTFEERKSMPDIVVSKIFRQLSKKFGDLFLRGE